ncbi:MAG TPA: signal peptidase II [Sphingomonadales bacterium]|nr:signal peptidase II [Sphingomonadales bacterium]
MQKAGFALAAAIFMLDRATKWWVLGPFDLAAKGDVALLPFFNLTLVWNRGISLGLFPMASEAGRFFLIALTAAISAFVAAWLWRAERLYAALALGLVLGGAVGNIWDRAAYGAVADFLHFHAFGLSFYIFNVADAAITAGVAVLLFDALLLRKKPNT